MNSIEVVPVAVPVQHLTPSEGAHASDDREPSSVAIMGIETAGQASSNIRFARLEWLEDATGVTAGGGDVGTPVRRCS
jgi:hypothetical protein